MHRISSTRAGGQLDTRVAARRRARTRTADGYKFFVVR